MESAAYRQDIDYSWRLPISFNVPMDMKRGKGKKKKKGRREILLAQEFYTGGGKRGGRR